MSAAIDIALAGCRDYAFSEIVNGLLSAGLIWDCGFEGELSADYYRPGEKYSDPSRVASSLFSFEDDPAQLLAQLDAASSQGFAVDVEMLVDTLGENSYRIVVEKSKPSSYRIGIHDGRPVIGGTWLTDYTEVASKTITPLLQQGICFLEICITDENY